MTKLLVFCLTCGACLGEQRPYFASQHLSDFPNHKGFFVKSIIDPILSKNPDNWFKQKNIRPDIVRTHYATKLNKSENVLFNLQKLITSTRRFLTCIKNRRRLYRTLTQ